MLKPDKAAKVGDSPGFRRMFAPGRLTLGLFFPIEAFERDEPTMRDQERLARRAEELGFAALWARDVPLRDPNFGDVGQIHDPWVWLGWIAAQTSTIGLATGSIVLPLRHPLHTAKSTASVDQLSGGRFVLGVASGDRPVEFPAFGVDWHQRDVLFRENLAVIRRVLMEEFPAVQSSYGAMTGTADLVPKPVARLPVLITGSSRQDFAWIAAHADGWITYPREFARQAELALKSDEVEQKMKALVEAHRRLRVLEALRTRQQQAHRAAVLQQEERELGDLINARHREGASNL